MDGDAFFAGCEMALNPSLRGRPIYVGGGRRGDGIVIAANYEAKKFGVITGMACFEARRVCPKGILCRPHYEEYRRLSLEMFRLLQAYTPTLAPLSIDEGYLDLTDVPPSLFYCRDHIALMRRIKEEIWKKLGLKVSTGLASSRLLAKLATESGKPDGCVEIPPGAEKEFLSNVPVEDLTGIAQSRKAALAALGARTLGEVARLPGGQLKKRFGIFGQQLWLLANGRFGEDLVLQHKPRRNISSATTLPVDESDYQTALLFLQDQTERVVATFFRENLKARELWIGVRFKDLESKGRSVQFAAPQYQPALLNAVVTDLFWDILSGETRPIRQLSVGFGNFAPLNLQPDLFGDHAEYKRRRLHAAWEELETRLGRGALITARRALLQTIAPHQVVEKPKCPFLPSREMTEKIFGAPFRKPAAYSLPRAWGRSTSRCGKDLALA